MRARAIATSCRCCGLAHMALAESRWIGPNMSYFLKRHGEAVGATNFSERQFQRDLSAKDHRQVPSACRHPMARRSGSGLRYPVRCWPRQRSRFQPKIRWEGIVAVPSCGIFSSRIFPMTVQALRGVFLTCCPSASSILITRSGQEMEPRNAAISSPSGTSNPLVAI